MGVFQYDRMRQQSVRSNEANRTTVTDVGGGMYGVSLQSTFGGTLTTKFSFNYNNKQGNDTSSYDQSLMDLGVPVSIFQSTTLNQGIPTGVGNIFNEGGYGTMAIENSSYSVIRGDVTWFKQEGLGGSHEFQTGFLLMPRNSYKGSSIVIDPSGWTAQSVRLRDPNNMNSGDDPVLTHVRDERARDRQHQWSRTVTTGSTFRTRGGRSIASR